MISDDLILPSATCHLAQAEHDLLQHGIAILEGVLSESQVNVYSDELLRIAEFERRTSQMGAFNPTDEGTQRVWNLPSRSPLFCELVEHPTALHMVKASIGWPALLSNLSANITLPGSGEMPLHADQSLSPLPWDRPHSVNLIWCLSDFTDELGATRIVPGSHMLNRPAGEDDQSVRTAPAEAKAGSLIVMEGRMWHKTGSNRTKDGRRLGVFGYYTLPIFIPQENWWLSLDPSVRQFGSDTLKALLGFKETSPMGRVNGLPVG